MKPNYLGLWLILTISLAIFIAISFMEEMKIGNYEIKKSTFSQTLINKPLIETDSLDVKSSEKDSIKDKAKEEILETDTLPKNIFLFGDSMTLNLAIRMSKYAKKNGHEFHAVNWDSSNTKLWAETDTLQYFLNKFSPDYIFICLGSNEVFFKDPSSRTPYIKKILSRIGDIPYIWIGPPNWNEDTGINDLLLKECKKGSFFKSEGLKLKRKSDGIHPTKSASALWVDTLMAWLPKSSHPILHAVPEDTMPKSPVKVTILKALNR